MCLAVQSSDKRGGRKSHYGSNVALKAGQGLVHELVLVLFAFAFVFVVVAVIAVVAFGLGRNFVGHTSLFVGRGSLQIPLAIGFIA